MFMLLKYYTMNIFVLAKEARVNEEAKEVFLKRWKDCGVGISGEAALSGSPTYLLKVFQISDDIKRRDGQFRINALRKEARSSEEARNVFEKLCMESNIGVPIDELIEMSTPIFDTTILPNLKGVLQ